ncbi:hypothetical protein GCM10010275_48520 [Streptomyces litmocidini]|uniref:hypothetical protein n=1 Tax=Streptomyces litmocidini TaxID=67318 RepID=UPI00167E9B52|nr:hypothetical protein [Streptomyces litmocidini]GGV03458.1 hypothetical protein GCM10010275_48520 [Streptomyces litmocidini]
MTRDTAGSVLALAGATAAVRSPFRARYDGRPGRDHAIDELFTGVTDAQHARGPSRVGRAPGTRTRRWTARRATGPGRHGARRIRPRRTGPLRTGADGPVPRGRGPTDRSPAHGPRSDPSSAAPTQTHDVPTRDRDDGSPPPPRS